MTKLKLIEYGDHQEWRDENGHHNSVDDHPIRIYNDGRKEWAVDNTYLRENGPCRINLKTGSTFFQVKDSDNNTVNGKEAWTKVVERRNPGCKVTFDEKTWITHFKNEKGQPHRPTRGPAIVNSKTGAYEWFLNGARHRTDGPARRLDDGTEEYWVHNTRLSKEEFDEIGKSIKYELWIDRVVWKKDNQIHRDGDEPAAVWFDGSTEYIKNGNGRREDAPRFIRANGARWYGTFYEDGSWLKNLNNSNPGYQITRFVDPNNHFNSAMEFRMEGVLHREEDKPAIIRDSGTKEWYCHGERHRVNGPAIRHHWDAEKDEYWLDGKQYSKQEWLKERKLAPLQILKKTLEKLKDKVFLLSSIREAKINPEKSPKLYRLVELNRKITGDLNCAIKHLGKDLDKLSKDPDYQPIFPINSNAWDAEIKEFEDLRKTLIDDKIAELFGTAQDKEVAQAPTVKIDNELKNKVTGALLRIKSEDTRLPMPLPLQYPNPDRDTFNADRKVLQDLISNRITNLEEVLNGLSEGRQYDLSQIEKLSDIISVIDMVLDLGKRRDNIHAAYIEKSEKQDKSNTNWELEISNGLDWLGQIVKEFPFPIVNPNNNSNINEFNSNGLNLLNLIRHNCSKLKEHLDNLINGNKCDISSVEKLLAREPINEAIDNLKKQRADILLQEYDKNFPQKFQESQSNLPSRLLASQVQHQIQKFIGKDFHLSANLIQYFLSYGLRNQFPGLSKNLRVNAITTLGTQVLDEISQAVIKDPIITEFLESQPPKVRLELTDDQLAEQERITLVTSKQIAQP